MTTPDSVGAYITSQPPSSRKTLKRVRSVLRKALPAAEEVISYGIPAYRIEGRRVIYFAGWRKHYSLYPAGSRLVAAFAKELEPYEYNDKGTIRFPLAEPVPAQLITRIARFRMKEEAARAAAKKSRFRA